MPPLPWWFWSSAVLTGSPTPCSVTSVSRSFWSSAVLTGSPTRSKPARHSSRFWSSAVLTGSPTIAAPSVRRGDNRLRPWLAPRGVKAGKYRRVVRTGGACGIRHVDVGSSDDMARKPMCAARAGLAAIPRSLIPQRGKPEHLREWPDIAYTARRTRDRLRSSPSRGVHRRSKRSEPWRVPPSRLKGKDWRSPCPITVYEFSTIRTSVICG